MITAWTAPDRHVLEITLPQGKLQVVTIFEDTTPGSVAQVVSRREMHYHGLLPREMGLELARRVDFGPMQVSGQTVQEFLESL